MISLVCADSNLALKLVLVEPDSGLAKQLWRNWQQQGIDVMVTRDFWTADERPYNAVSIYLPWVHLLGMEA